MLSHRRLHTWLPGRSRTGKSVVLLGLLIFPLHLAVSLFAEEAPARDRPDTEVGRLLDQLAEQNQQGFNDAWLRTMQDIVDLGPAAVPELIVELDSTADNRMMRCLGFTLRAIGDRRAVPALIRAIPKTLLPSGSDLGLSTDDPELLKFAQHADLDPTNRGNHYGLGRPVREICGALQTLTDQKLGEEELYSVFLSDVETQNRLRRQLFQKTAQMWAGWWEENWSKYVDDKSFSKVELSLPPPETPLDAPEFHYKTGGGHSNWVLESVLNTKAKRVFLDFDTGRVSQLPEKWRMESDIGAHLEDIIAWACHEGFDLMGTEYTSPKDGHRVHALRPIAMPTWELGKERWKMSADNISLDTLQSEGLPVAGLLLHYDPATQALDPDSTATFLYMTREGSVGLLFVGVDVQDDSLKPGGRASGDDELRPIAFSKGRRFGFNELTPIE